MVSAAQVAPRPAATPKAVATCAAIVVDAQRLACYDRVSRDASATVEPLTAPSVDSPSVQTPVGEAPTGLSLTDFIASKATTVTWELTPKDKRGTFVLRTYYPNFLLPVHATSAINRTPYSPTRGASTTEKNYRPIEAKLQVSMRAKVAEDVLLPNADVWFAYTQRSMWQVWNRQDSAPFRNTDYQPEAIFVVPTPEILGALPGGWRWRMTQLGIAHQSNGQSEPLSRSWNRWYVHTAFDRGEYALSARFNKRMKEDASSDDNPDLTEHIGNTELSAAWWPGQSTATLTWRLHPRHLGKGSLQLDWSTPVDSAQPAGLRWYVQAFTGFGETLLDYNHRQTSLGLGVTLFQL